MTKPATIDEYEAHFPVETQTALAQIRSTVKGAVAEATETISYGIPTFRLGGKNLLHYGAFASHIGLYATPDGHEEFEEELSRYKRGKGSVQFPLGQAMPLDLIERIALFRADQLKQK